MQVKLVYDGPIPAPLNEGQQVAKVVVSAPGEETIEIPLQAGAAVERLGFFGRVTAGLEHLIFGVQ